MKSRQQIEQSMKDIVIPSGRDDIRVTLELLMDIRDLLSGLLSIEQTRDSVEAARRARELSALRRYGNEEKKEGE